MLRRPLDVDDATLEDQRPNAPRRGRCHRATCRARSSRSPDRRGSRPCLTVLTFVDAVHWAPHLRIERCVLRLRLPRLAPTSSSARTSGVLWGRRVLLSGRPRPTRCGRRATTAPKWQTGTAGFEGIAGAFAAVRYRQLSREDRRARGIDATQTLDVAFTRSGTTNANWRQPAARPRDAARRARRRRRRSLCACANADGVVRSRQHDDARPGRGPWRRGTCADGQNNNMQ